MTTDRQKEANRRNAQKSTGPKTPEGKARSTQNATKHGLTSRRVVLADEDAAEFAEMRMALHEDLRPESQLEALLVNRIAAQQWRLARIPALEAELLDNLRDDLVLGDVGLGGAWAKDAEPYGGALMRLARYETMLERSVARLLAELRRAQSERRRHEREGLAQLVAERESLARESPMERWRKEANGLSGPAAGGLGPLSLGSRAAPLDVGSGEESSPAAPLPNEANALPASALGGLAQRSIGERGRSGANGTG